MPHLHLPVQSGSDRILAAMNRRHARAPTISTRSSACAACDPTWRFRPISSSASPGETAADFALTLALIEEVGFAGAYSFKYSARPGHPGGRHGGPGARGGQA